MQRYELNARLAPAIEDLAQKIERRVLAQIDVERANTAPHSVRACAVESAQQALHTAGAGVEATSLELSDTILDVIERMQRPASAVAQTFLDAAFHARMEAGHA